MQVIMWGIVVPAALGTILAGILAARLRRNAPSVYEFAGKPSTSDWHPFWVIRFVVLKGFRMVDRASSLLAVTSSLLMVVAFIFAIVSILEALMS
jgi:hypothetical protein